MVDLERECNDKMQLLFKELSPAKRRVNSNTDRINIDIDTDSLMQ